MYGDDVRCGVVRASMKTNCLLAKPELGKVKAVTTTLPPRSHAYGIPSATNTEGAREVTMLWKEHVPNPDVKPGPDFRGMNRRATINGVTKSKDIRPFRAEHPMTMKRRSGQTRPSSGSRLQGRVFGMDSSYRSAEKIRMFGEKEPFMQHLIQGAYQQDWTRQAKKKEYKERRTPRDPAPTKASRGHAEGANRLTQSLDARTAKATSAGFKMRKFQNVAPKVNSFAAAAAQTAT